MALGIRLRLMPGPGTPAVDSRPVRARAARARHLLRRPVHGLGAARERLGAGRPAALLDADVEHLLGPFPVRPQLVGARARQTVLRPPSQDGFERRAMPEATVDFGAAAHAAAFDIGDRHVPEDRRHAAGRYRRVIVSVDPGIGWRLTRRIAFFDQQHVVAA